MSLEDDIGRMADARASAIDTPSWHDRVGAGRRRWPVMVAAAAIVAVVAGLAISLLPDDDDPDTDVAADPETTQVTTTTVADTTTSMTTTTDPVTTTIGTLQQTGICAANPIPSDDVLDVATHIAFDRTPLDLDLDGVPDEMLIYDDPDGVWFLIARLQTGWTNALPLHSDVVPELGSSPDGSPAAADIDGDGGLEVLIAGPESSRGEDVRFVGEDVGFVVWMDAAASSDQHADIRALLDQFAGLSYEYVDQQATFEEFQELFADTPEMLEIVTPEQLPPSYRVVPEAADSESIEELVGRFEGRPGVRDVSTADATFQQLADESAQEALLSGEPLEGNAIVVSLDGCDLHPFN